MFCLSRPDRTHRELPLSGFHSRRIAIWLREQGTTADDNRSRCIPKLASTGVSGMVYQTGRFRMPAALAAIMPKRDTWIRFVDSWRRFIP